MDTRQMPVTGSIVLLLLVAAGGMAAVHLSRSDVTFCREVLTALAQGRPSVKPRIAWERLQAVGVDVGATYAQLPSDQDRAQYRQTFVESFSRGFQQSGGAVNGFRHWRVKERSNARVVIAVDYVEKGMTLLMTVPASGPKKLETIQWQ